MKKLSMRLKIILISTIPTIISLAILGEIAYHYSKSGIIDQVLEKLESGVSFYHSALNTQIDDPSKINEQTQKILDAMIKEKVGKTGYMFVMDNKGILVAHPKLKGQSVYQHQFIKDMILKRNGVMKYLWDGRTKVTAFRTLDKTNWIVASGSYMDDFMGSITTIRNTFITLFIAIGLIMVVISFIFSKKLITSLIDITNELISQSTQNLSCASNISDSSITLAQNLTKQAANIEETSSSVEEIAAMVKQNSDNSRDAKKISEEVMEELQKGVDAADRLNSSMAAIIESNDKIQELVNSIEEINQKTKIIDEIVFQTKLLSFNASVEAERAGEHGRGFAVVAQEVGSLAQLSGKAALEISQIVKSGLETTNRISSENKSRVTDGNKIVNEVSAVFSKIGDKADKNYEWVTAINNASQEQTQGIQQINLAVSDMDRDIQSNAALSEQNSKHSDDIANSAKHLKIIATRLNTLIAG